jgi:hypothetical protein
MEIKVDPIRLLLRVSYWVFNRDITIDEMKLVVRIKEIDPERYSEMIASLKNQGFKVDINSPTRILLTEKYGYLLSHSIEEYTDDREEYEDINTFTISLNLSELPYRTGLTILSDELQKIYGVINGLGATSYFISLTTPSKNISESTEKTDYGTLIKNKNSMTIKLTDISKITNSVKSSLFRKKTIIS